MRQGELPLLTPTPCTPASANATTARAHGRGARQTLRDQSRSLDLRSLSYGEVWARRNVYSAPLGYYKCTATHETPIWHLA